MSGKALILSGTFLVAAIVPLAGARAEGNTQLTACGGAIKTTILTDTTPDTGTNNTQFVPLPGAKATLTVPAGARHCFKVRFSASASCSGGEGRSCLIEVRDTGNLAKPQGEIVFTSDSQLVAAHAFEWVKPAAPGTHTITVRIRVDDSRTGFLMSGWTMSIRLTN
jgi:hypothetical protein